jgi:enamine deaminase RidA (YjgF/YER057c/UK114 family)
VAGGTQRHRDGISLEQKAGYSRAVRRLGHIAVSGTTATGADGGVLHPGDTYRQSRAAIEKALMAVQALGGRTEDVVRTRIYLGSDANWEEAARAHAELLGTVAPANTMLYAGGLIGDGFLVEVEVDAEVDENTLRQGQ